MVLKRVGSKGVVVLWPKGWGKRWHSQNFPGSPQTACDRLVGGCSCGRFHAEDDEETRIYLRDNNATIESHQEWLDRTQGEK